jgi:hypothetical protein
MRVCVRKNVDTSTELLGGVHNKVFSPMTLPLEPPERRSIAIAPAVQLKKFYRTCSAIGVFLTSRLVGLSTSDSILLLMLRRFMGQRKGKNSRIPE